MSSSNRNEGPSEASALERWLVKCFDRERIVSKIIMVYGDITILIGNIGSNDENKTAFKAVKD